MEIKDVAIAAAHNVPARHKSSKPRVITKRLESFENLPDYLKDNEFIMGSYRTEQTVWDSVKTLFVLHNETGNVWTHFLGFFLFAALAVYFFYHPPTPLAMTAEHVEGLIHDMQHQLQHLGVTDNLQAISSSLTQKVHVFEDKLSHAFSGNFQQLHGNLQQIQGNLQHIQGNLHSNLRLVGSRLSDNLHQLQDTLQDSLHNVEVSLHNRAATLSSNVEAALQQQLKPVLQWPSPRWPVYVYFGGACVCLLTSGVCHLLGCCQKHIAEMVWRFDYAGIAVLIVTSFVPAMYYAFLCEPFWRNFYLFTTASMGVVVVGLSLPSMFQAREYRVLRATVFVLLGSWGVVPVTHLLLNHGHVWAIRRAFQLDLLMGFIYVWRDAAGGCAAPGSVNGPLQQVLFQLQQQGQSPLTSIEQVYEHMISRLANLAALHP
eukprot:gene5147-5387_t